MTKQNNGKNHNVAIIGMGCCFPDAANIKEYWENICKGHVAIREVPSDRWSVDSYYSEDRNAPEKTYSRIGGFLSSFQFDAKRFRIPPKTLASVDDLQKLALTAAAEALESAGLQVFGGQDQGRAFDRDRCAVIMGNAMGGEHEDLTSLRVWFPEARCAVEASPAWQQLPSDVRQEVLREFEKNYKLKLPPVNEDSMPGELSNCITGRVANALDLRGPNFTTDAACAASMAALKAAVLGLQAGEFDMAIAGGADRSMDPPTYVKFSKIGALSPDISAPFDARANGFVMGEGVGVVVLKRQEDAERDGDTIYALITGIGAASDGKGKGMTAPNPRGQELAVRRAYESAGVGIDTVGLFEAHGTSTSVGDATELAVLTQLLRESGTPARKVPIGSVKSMIGHLKSAAGSASVIKTALALHHKTLPPSANFESAHKGSPLEEGFLDVVCTTEPWVTSSPRRAGVSAFGFGGTNFHIVLEEHVSQNESAKVSPSASEANTKPASPSTPVAAPSTPAKDATTYLSEITTLFADKTGYAVSDLDPSFHLESDLGIDTVKQAEIFAVIRETYGLVQDESFRLAEVATLAQIADYIVARRPAASTDVSAAPALVAVGADQVTQAPKSHPQVLVFGGATAAAAIQQAHDTLAQVTELTDARVMQARRLAAASKARIAFVADSIEEAREKVNEASTKRAKILAAQGIFVNEGESLGDSPEVAFLFPGQGSQYVGMFADLAQAYPIVADTFREADEVLLPIVGAKITDIVWPKLSAGDDVEAAELLLRQTQYCQPAMLTADVAMLRLLQQYGVTPHRVAGHSLGEYAACVAAGVLSFADALYAVSARGREMAGVEVPDNGKMAMVAADAEKVGLVLAKIIETTGRYVIAANKNCFTQTVIAGESEAVVHAISTFKDLGVEAREIPVSHAFHSRIVAPATKPLERVLNNLDVRAPVLPISSNVDASYYPADRQQMIALMARQLASPVEFIQQVQRLYDDGARIFIEVGPRRAITGFVRNILGKQDHRALATNHHKKPGIENFFETLAALASDGIELRLEGDEPVARTPAAEIPLAVKPVPSSAQVAITGASIALPTEQPVGPLSEDPFARLLSGENFIKQLATPARAQILSKNVVRLKKESGDFEPLRELTDVVQLVARLGDVSLETMYGIDTSFADALDITGRLAIAVGIDALRDAGIPLVRHYRTTSTGKKLPDRWGLPPALARSTGVIMASAFPGIDRLIDDVSRHVAHRSAESGAQALVQFVDELTASLKDQDEALRLRTLFAQRANEWRDEAGTYAFNRKFLFRVLSMGHAQFAQTILAQGPNTQVNAACASGTQAIAMAEDWIRLGRCERVVVISVDDVTHEQSLPWIAAGFLAAGAATTESRVEQAAVPFGAKRNGMILGSGATALVVEAKHAAGARGLHPIADILHTSFVNSAFHGTRLDSEFIKKSLRDVVENVAQQVDCAPDELARRSFFLSHETYTPARGGSSAAEVEAIRFAFGSSANELLIANTKGYTGHPMGATFEDVVAIKGLQRQTLPAIANMDDVDPSFADLRFAKGGSIQADIAFRFAAGFGSQVAIAAYKQVAREEARLYSKEAYQTWLSSHVGEGSPTGLELVARTLRVNEQGEGVPVWELGIPSLQLVKASLPEPVASVTPSAAEISHVAPSRSRDEILREVTALFAQQTGYDIKDLDPAFALEADLGIDTVKQAEIFAILRERYQLPRDENFKLAEVSSLALIADYLLGYQTQTVSAAPSEAVASPKVGLSRDAILSEVTSLFAEHTGYELSDLDPSYALEADLGIDTVKQAEIIAIIRDKWGIARDDSFKLADIPTLNAIVDFVLKGQGDVSVAETQPSMNAESPLPEAQTGTNVEVKPTAAAAPAGNREAMLREVTELFATHTGYELADLDPAFALEADLGIDTVKQAEIFAIIRERYGLPKDDTFKLSDVQSIDAIVDYIAAGATAAEPVEPSVKQSVSPSALVEGAFAAQGVIIVPLPKQPSSRRDVASRHLVLCGTPGALHQALKSRLESLGGRVTTMPVQAFEDVEAYFKNLKPIDDVIIVADDLGTSAAASIEANIRQAFVVCRAFGKTRATMRDAGVLLVGQSAGVFGFHDQSGTSVVLAGFAGIAKTLAKEWAGAHCLACDLDNQIPADLAAEQALTEWLATVRHPLVAEIGFCHALADATNPTGRFTLRRGPQTAAATTALPQDSVVVATGGARGVTYELLKTLAERSKLRFVILARTGAVEPGKSPLANQTEEQQKATARAALQQSGERVTPALVQRWLTHERNRLEVASNIAALRALGSDVDLIVCDASDDAALESAAKQVKSRYGVVDVVLHGAGVEESKPLIDKDLGAFDRVFVPKARSALRLLELFHPKRLVTMGSVSGRFGNLGQVDYAAANEVMAGLARQSGSAVLNLAWTAWGDVGMATRGSIKQVLEAHGVELLPVTIGAKFGADLIASGSTGDVVIAGALGELASAEQTLGPVTAPRVQAFIHEAPLPWLFTRVEDEGDKRVYHRLLDPKRDPGLDHHRIEGVAVLPGVLGVELMTQAAQHARGQRATRLQNVRFDSPLKIFGDEPIEVRVEVAPTASDAVDVTLASDFKTPKGKVMRRVHFSARVAFDSLSAHPMLAPRAVEMPRNPAIGATAIYQRYFHGPSFQVLSQVMTLGEDGADARPIEARPAWFTEGTHDDFMTEPFLREAGFQTAGLWEMAELGRMALPSGIDEVLLINTPKPKTRLVVQARRRGTEVHGSVFDVWVRDEDGVIYDVMRGYRTASLRDLQAAERFEPARSTEPAPAWLELDIEPIGAELDERGKATLERYLSAPELARYGELKTAKRRVEWLAGRIAAKRLIREHRFCHDGAIVAYHAVEILPDDLGAPRVRVTGERGPWPLISISHTAGVAAAMLSVTPNVVPGIDVEHIERREPAFAATYFTETERERAQASLDMDKTLTAMWAVKEAMLKALGIGARVDLRDITVFERDGQWHVSLQGEAKHRAQQLEAGAPKLEVDFVQERVVARVELPVGKSHAAVAIHSSTAEATL